MNPEGTMLSETSQAQRTTTAGVHFYEVPRVVEFREGELKGGLEEGSIWG